MPSVPSQLLTAVILVPQVEDLAQATQDSHFIVQLRTICDLVLYTYLSRVADTAERRHYLDLSCTVLQVAVPYFRDLDAFLDNLHKFEALDLHLSIFQPYNLRVLFVTISDFCRLSGYFKSFRSDPERSKEFHYEDGLWHAFVATRYMQFLRTPSDPR